MFSLGYVLKGYVGKIEKIRPVHHQDSSYKGDQPCFLFFLDQGVTLATVLKEQHFPEKHMTKAGKLPFPPDLWHEH